MTLRVVVAGAGIGGLATGIALRRAGHDVVVLEQADDVRRIQIGAGLQLWTNAMRAMQRLGLADAAKAVSSETEHFQYRTWRGRLLSDWPVAQAAQRLGAPTVGISRPDLHDVLLHGVGDGIVRLGSACTSFRDDADGVTVELADGAIEYGDVLVGADGIASAVRAQLLGDAGPRYSGVTSWRWVLPEEDERAPRGLFQVMMGPGKLFILYRVGRGRPYSLAIVRTSEGTRGHDDPRVDLRQHFKGWPTQVGSLIEDAQGAARPTRADLYERPPQKQWGAGRVTLLGDAAHAMMPHVGQGAGTAIEDAVVLARCLGEAGPDLPGALRAYEDERRKRTAKLQRLARAFGKINTWKSGPARATRDAVMRVAYRRVVWRIAQKDLDVEL